jgi:hypothetical protein
MKFEVKKCAQSKGGMTDTKHNETQHYGIIVTLSKVFVGRNAVLWFIMLSVFMHSVIIMSMMSIIMMIIIMMIIIMMIIII